MKKIFYYFHYGSYNHGCEAIVRSTTALIGIKPIIISENPNQDYEYQIDKIAEIKGNESFSTSLFEKIIIKLSESDKRGYLIQSKHDCSVVEPNSIAMSIGGDNYCYGDAFNWRLEGYNKELHRRRVKTVLWGCSINPESVNNDMKKDLALYDLIVARESISYEYLKNINCNTLFACDPAFSLEKEDLPLPNQFLEGYTVGINTSPLIQRSERKQGIAFKNYCELVNYIIDKTTYNIALISHVKSDDVPLEQLVNCINDKSRVCILKDYNCCQIKGFISRCIMFIGARTHATIAAYSTCVPTLVVGYSTKAIGIARDLFGTEENYVLPVQKLNESTQMIDAFIWLNKHRIEIRNHLKDIIPEYKLSINEAVKKVREL